MKEMVCVVQARTENALLVRIGDVADRNSNIQLKLQWVVRAIHSRAARGFVAERGILRKLSLKHRSV